MRTFSFIEKTKSMSVPNYTSLGLGSVAGLGLGYQIFSLAHP